VFNAGRHTNDESGKAGTFNISTLNLLNAFRTPLDASETFAHYAYFMDTDS
jgi:hypothetical protein